MTSDPSNKDIVDYYDFSKLDYCLYNGSLTELSMHYGIWDDSTRTHREALLNENRVLAHIAHIQANDKVLDVGCGYGTSSFWLADNIGCTVVGCNISQNQVEEARRHAKARMVQDRVSFAVTDFHHLSFPDGVFDVVFAIESVSHSSQKTIVLAELFRVLKPGGRLVLADGYFAKDPETLTKREVEIAKACFEGVHVPALPLLPLFRQWLVQTGFTGIEWTDKTESIMKTSLRVHRLGRILLPIGKMLRFLGIRALHPQHMMAFIEQYNAFHSRLGVYGVYYATKP